MKILATLLIVSALCVLPRSARAENPIGGNLDGISDWSWSNAFADLMKQGRKFGSPDKPWDGSATTDSTGWPNEDFGVVLATFGGQKAVAGTYKIRFHDAVVPQVSLTSSPGQIQVLKLDSTGYVTANLIFPAGGSQIMLSFANTKGGVRDLQVMRPGYAFGTVFTTSFLNHVKTFDTLRFMDWASTNGSPIIHWADRPGPTIPSYAWQGVPWEVCIQLCNQVARNAWINVPHMADAAYVHQLALLFNSRLNPKLVLNVEYSNEVWNWGFAQSQWNLAQATAAGKTSELNWDGVNNPGYWAARRIGQQIVGIGQSFKQVYGAAAYQARVRPVLATQWAYPGLWLVQALDFIVAKRGDPQNFVCEIAVAPYFNLGTDQTVDGLSVDKVLSDLSAGVDSDETAVCWEKSASMATYYHLDLVGYEAGSDTFGTGSIASKHVASMDPGIRPIITKYVADWFGYGGKLMNWFVAGATDYDSQYGTWGLADDMQNLPTAPKNVAVQAARTASFQLKNGILLPADVDARENTDRNPNWATGGDVQMSTTEWYGPYLEWFLRAPSARAFNLVLSAHADSAPIRVSISIDDKSMGQVTVPVSAASTESTALSLSLPAGYHTLRFTVLDPGNLWVHSIAIH